MAAFRKKNGKKKGLPPLSMKPKVVADRRTGVLPDSVFRENNIERRVGDRRLIAVPRRWRDVGIVVNLPSGPKWTGVYRSYVVMEKADWDVFPNKASLPKGIRVKVDSRYADTPLVKALPDVMGKTLFIFPNRRLKTRRGVDKLAEEKAKAVEKKKT